MKAMFDFIRAEINQNCVSDLNWKNIGGTETTNTQLVSDQQTLSYFNFVPFGFFPTMYNPQITLRLAEKPQLTGPSIWDF